MKKHLHTHDLLIRIMRTTMTQWLLAILCISLAYATDAPGQDLLQKPISIRMEDKSLKSILTRIEQEADVKFMYSPRAIHADRPTSAKFQNQPLSEVLEVILKPLSISYRVSGSHIILSRQQAPAQLPEEKQSSSLRTEAPDWNLTGTVTDESGVALPGVSIVLKGTQRGTTSGADGKFSIQVPDGVATLIFSFVGYLSQEINVGNQSVLDISLKADTKILEEVVVVGYGTVQKKDLTGAVSSVQGDAITNRKTTQISQALQGSMPGVMVSRGSNAPGSTASIRIRGITTITDAGANPLIILDGVPIDDINSINPNDVESISVLKDAASASIYGSRAAAGVILVTTKRAKNGQLNLDYTTEYGVERPTYLPDYVNASRYMQLTNELRWNDNNNNAANEYPVYSKDIIDNYSELNRENPDLHPNTDWRNLILNSTAPRTSHMLSIAGSGKALRSRVSFGYDNIGALYDDRNYARVTARSNNDVTINDYLSASVDFNFRRTVVKQPVVDPLYRAGITPPIFAGLWSDGRVASGKDGDNIYGRLKYGGFNNAWYNQVGGRISLDFTPVKGLKVSGVLSPFFNFDKVKVFNKKIPFTPWDDPNTVAGYINDATQTKLDESRNDNYRYTTQFLANYNRQAGRHSLGLLAGYEYFYAFNENLGASRDQYLLNSYPFLDIGPLEFRNNSGGAFENAYRSWFGRVMYSYADKYLIQANIRYDASSRFAPGYRWGSFPSVSAGWVISEEPFLKDTGSWLSFLKLRASWGSLGNERIGNYPYHSILSFENNSLFYQGNNVVSAQSAAQFQYAIRDISWETTESYDIGFDANFLRDRLRVTADYYKKTTRDMLLKLQIPQYIGFDNPDQNTGKMFTNGWEMQASWNDKIGEFRYSASVNLSDFRSRMGNLGGTEFLGDQIKLEGSEFNEWYGYLSNGLFQTQEEVKNSPVLNANVRPGDVRYRDISGPDGIPDGKISPEYDRVFLGGSLPRLMYGANFNLGYKNWDFGLVLQGVGKQNSRLGSHMIRPLQENFGNFPVILDGNSWSVYNTAEQNQNVRYPRYTNTSAGNNYAMSDYWLINGGYFRLKNISLGYTIPNALTEKVKIQSVRLYGTATDLWSKHNFPKGWDPEMNSLSYPITTAFVFGASVKF